MKNNLFRALAAGLLTLVLSQGAAAQRAPGWGWVTAFGETPFSPFLSHNSVAGVGHDAAGNLYLAGSYLGTPAIGGAATTNQGETDVLLAKYTPAGQLVWLRTLQSTGTDVAARLVVEPSGRCTLAGSFGANGGGDLGFADFGTNFFLPGPARRGLPSFSGQAGTLTYGAIPFVAAVEADGSLSWAFCPSPTYGLLVNDLTRDRGGNVYLAATATEGLEINGQRYPKLGSSDAVLLKLDVNGQSQWARRVGVVDKISGSSAVTTDGAGAVYWQLGNGGPVTIAQFTVTASSYCCLVKLLPDNQVKWVKSKFFQSGNTELSTALLGFDSGTNALYLEFRGPGGEVVFPGLGSPILLPATKYTSCVARCDTSGRVNWVKPISYATYPPNATIGSMYVNLPKIYLDGNGFTLLTSTAIGGQTTFSGSAATYGPADGGLVCVLHFNTTTDQVEWTRVAGTPPGVIEAGTQAVQAATDPAGNVYVAGTYAGPAQFGSTALPYVSRDPRIFLAKLDQALTLAAKAATPSLSWSVYPNPATGTVQLTGLPAQAQVRVYDALGRQVSQLPASSTSSPRTLAGLAPGLYLLQVSQTQVPYQSQRLLIQ